MGKLNRSMSEGARDMDPSTLERFGRRLRVGMVGGGVGSFIGETHRIALRSDGLWDLVAGSSLAKGTFLNRQEKGY